MIINNNISAMFVNREMSNITRRKGKIIEKLSSGISINSASDNAAGLSISEKIRAQIRGLRQATRNVQDGISLIQTAEGSLAEIQNSLQRIRELSVQAASSTLNDDDREKIQREVNEIKDGINEIIYNSEFNSSKLFINEKVVAPAIGEIPLFDLQWTSIKTSPSPEKGLSGIASNGQIFVTVGSGGKIFISNNGVDWGEQSSGVAALLKVEYQNGLFFAMGPGSFLISSDGTTWVSKISSIEDMPSYRSADYNDVIYHQGQYIVAVGNGYVLTSNDGNTWMAQDINVGSGLNSITYGAGKYIAVGNGGRIITSTDGTIWNSVDSQTTNSLRSIIWADGVFVAVGEGGTIVTSKDGINWLKQYIDTKTYLDGVAFSGKQVLAIGGTQDQVVQVGTSDFINWEIRIDNIGSRPHDIIFQGDRFWAVTHEGVIIHTNSLIQENIEVTKKLDLQVGANSGDDLSIELPLLAEVLNLESLLVNTSTNAGNNINLVDEMMGKVGFYRSKLGAYENRLEHRIRILDISQENLTNAESRIRDQDLARGVFELAKADILEKAGLVMLAQANQIPERILQLLG